MPILDDEVIELPSKQLQMTGSFARFHVIPKTQKISELVPELASDAATDLLKALADIVRYRKQDAMSTAHALTRVMVNDTPAIVIVSATVIPLDHVDVYGQTFADDISKVCADLDAHNEKQGRKRYDAYEKAERAGAYDASCLLTALADLDARKCDCENNHCIHVAGDCKKPAGDTVTIFESRLCDDCAQVMPKEYLK